MKILQVIPFFSAKFGGSVTVAYQVSRELAKRGHEVTIITSDFEFDQDLARGLENYGIKVIAFPTTVNIALFIYTPMVKKWFDNNIDKFDVVHLHDFRTYQNIIAHHYSIKNKIPYVIQPHASTPRKGRKKILKMFYDFFYGYSLLSQANHIIAVSREEAFFDEQLGALAKNITVVYNGMNLKEFENLPENGNFRLKYSINGEFILYLGRIHRLKGIDFIINGFSMLIKDKPNITLIIAGPDDGYQVNLEKLIVEKNIRNNVKFIGFLSENEKLSAYLDADLFVNTPIYMGGVGITTIEAILCGTPVIVTDECGEIIKDANCGYVVTYGDTDDLVDKMKLILENPEKGKVMVDRGKKYIYQHLNWGNVIENIEAIYADCIYNI